jgi:glycosyltransferase involved in cell wall biosynthesis
VIVAKHINKPLVLEFNSSESVKWRDTILPFAKKKHGTIIRFFINIASPIIEAILRIWERRVLDKADKIVVVSEVLKQSLLDQGVEDTKIIVRPNAVDPNTFKLSLQNGTHIRKKLGISSEHKVAGFAGTFGNWHGIPELTEAIKKTQRIKNLSYLLIGEGAMKKEMQKQLGKFDNVFFVGRIPFAQMPAYLSACDILIISNSWNCSSRKIYCHTFCENK